MSAVLDKLIQHIILDSKKETCVIRHKTNISMNSVQSSLESHLFWVTLYQQDLYLSFILHRFLLELDYRSIFFWRSYLCSGRRWRTMVGTYLSISACLLCTVLWENMRNYSCLILTFQRYSCRYIQLQTLLFFSLKKIVFTILLKAKHFWVFMKM